MSDSSTDKTSSEPLPAKETEPASFLSSIWSKEAPQKAWSWWDSVKSNPVVQQSIQEANERLHQAQEQANKAWESYDTKLVTSKLTELGRSATQYIDDADRKLEALENKTIGFLQQEGTKLVDIVNDVVETEKRANKDSEILYTGPDKPSISRLDAELMTLHLSPDKFLEPLAKEIPESEQIAKPDRQKLLESSSDLNDTYKSLVPATISDEEFWGRYAFNKSELVARDNRRKQLIERQDKTQVTEDMDNLDDWGSSDEEETLSAKSPTANTPSESKNDDVPKLSKSPKPLENREDGSDDDWE